MRLFQRTGDILIANANDLVDRFEQPDKMLRQALRDLSDQIETLRAALARSIAAERLLTKEHDAQETEIADWSRRASTALAAADEPLARRAIGRQLDAKRRLDEIAAQVAATRRANDLLRGRLEALRWAESDARRRLATWGAHAALVSAERQLGASVRAAQHLGALARIERFSERLDLAEAEAVAYDELQTTAGLDSATVDEFEAREREQEIASELERLRQSRSP